jgi:ABC-type phosphate transport system substrate-binding protein
MFRSKKGSKKTFVQIAVVVLGLTATHSLVASFPLMLSPVVAQSNSPSPSFPLPQSLPSGTILKADGSGSMRVIKEPLRKRSEEKFPGTKAQSNSPSPSFPLPKSLPSGTTVKVDGSNSMRVINEALRKGFEEKFPGTKVEAASGGTDGALAALLRGDIDMAAVGRPLTDKEKAQGLVAIPVSREKIAIIVGSDNPFKIKKNLTLVEFAKMFRGEITNWSQLGGAPGKIRFIDHPEWGDTRRSLGTYDIFKKAPFKNGANTTRLSQDDTATIVEALGKNGISYAIADQVLNLPNVRVIPLHKTLPSNPRYSYSQPQSYVYRQETVTPGMLAFLGFATSASGQEILAAAKQQEAEAVGQFPKSLPSGTTVKVDGSSSMRVINEALRKGFEEKFPGTKVELASSGGTDGALAALQRGDINMAAVGRPLTNKEKAQGLVATPVSREKIAIIVGSDNPFKRDLTFVEFAKIFRGEITNWSQLGGAPGKIRFIDHPEWGDTRRSLGTYDIFKKAPFKNGANTTRLSEDDTASIVQALGKDGISYAIADQVLNLPNVRVIPIYKTMPSDPGYPYSQPRGYVYRKETATPGTLAFVGFTTSAPGQEILADAKQQEAEAVRQSITSASTSGTSGVATGSSPSPAPNGQIALVPTSSGEPTEQGFPWWWLLLLAGIPLLGLLLWLLKERRGRRTEINNKIENLVANSNEINNKIENLRNDWNRTFMSLVTQHGDEVVNTIASRESFNRVITQKLVNNNAELSHYISQQIDDIFEQKIHNYMQVVARNLVQNKEELKQYIDQGLQHSVTSNTAMNNQLLNLVANCTETNNKIENLRNDWNQTFMSLVTQHGDEVINIIGSRESFNRVITQKLVNNNAELNHYVNQQIDNTYEQKVQNNLHLITQNIVNNNEGLNHYIDQRLQHNVINNSEVNNEIVNLVANSTEINHKINNVYRDIDIKIENVRNEWNQTFISLVTQQVDELINIIGDRDTFNIRVANLIDIKVDELLNQILRTKNELTAIINNADRHLYEWTLGELTVIKGCLSDREVLVEQLVTFSAQLRTKLDGTACVDINTFKPFKPISIDHKQQP